MKNTFLGIILLSVSFFTLYSQQIDKSAKKILDEVSSKVSNYKTFYIKFDYHYKVPSKKVNRSDKGEIFAYKELYNLNLSGENQIFDGSKVYTINKEDKEITISDKEESNFISPISLLNMYKKGFNIYNRGNKNINSKDCVIIELIPEKKENVKSILLAVAENDIVQISEIYNDGSFLNLIITKLMPNILINNKLFHFNKDQYKDFIITDL